MQAALLNPRRSTLKPSAAIASASLESATTSLNYHGGFFSTRAAPWKIRTRPCSSKKFRDVADERIGERRGLGAAAAAVCERQADTSRKSTVVEQTSIRERLGAAKCANAELGMPP